MPEGADDKLRSREAISSLLGVRDPADAWGTPGRDGLLRSREANTERRTRGQSTEATILLPPFFCRSSPYAFCDSDSDGVNPLRSTAQQSLSHCSTIANSLPYPFFCLTFPASEVDLNAHRSQPCSDPHGLESPCYFPSLDNGSSIANPLLNLLPNHCQRARREPQPLQTIVNLPLPISAALSIC